MNRLRFLTAGESHGPALVGILEGLPSGLWIDVADVDRDLARRQMGFGRGGRMRIEKDRAEILSGIRFSRTLGSPIALRVPNLDFANWTERMRAQGGGPDPRPVTVPRPGHADLAGALKYGHLDDLRNVLERASARETTVRVALGALAKAFLRELGVGVGSYVRSIGGVEASSAQAAAPHLFQTDAEGLAAMADAFETRALDDDSSKRLVARIQEAQKRRDTLGGVVEVVATALPPGLGSYVHWDRKLDGRLAHALMSIHAIKEVEVGDGAQAARSFGSEVHDPIVLNDARFARTQNRAGGLEGGVTNGEPLVVRAAMKPIATVSAALPSVDLNSLQAVPAHVERSDTCAVPAAGVVAEAMVALVLADALLESFGGDTLSELRMPFARRRVCARTDLGHVFLVGPMGVGKTTVGERLRAVLECPFIDLDAHIEAQQGARIGDVFARAGEAGFRQLEAAALNEVVARRPFGVIALGGGGALTEAAWRTLRQAGVVVRLEAPVEELARRIHKQDSGATRPLLSGADPQTVLASHLVARERWYARADVCVDTVGKTADIAAGAIVGLLEALKGGTPFGRGGA